MLAQAINNPRHAHKLAERVIHREITGIAGKSKRIGVKQAMSAFSGSCLAPSDLSYLDVDSSGCLIAPSSTHLDIQDRGHGCCHLR